MIALALLAAAAAAAPAGGDGIAMAKRLVAAIKGEAEFQQADFSRPLGDEDRAALRRFGACRVGSIGYTLTADPTEPNTYVEDHDWVSIAFACKGVPSATPAGISLHLRNGRIGVIETHNADLMRAK